MPEWTKCTSAPNPKNLTDEKVKALFEIAIMEEMEDVFKGGSPLSEDDISMIRTIVKNRIRTLIQHVTEGVISVSEFCEMQRAIFRIVIQLVR